MKRIYRPVLTTMFFGVGAAICFYPLSMVVYQLVPWHRAILITLGIYLVLYAFLVACQVAGQRGKTVVVAFVSTALVAFFLPTLKIGLGAMVLILGWIRSRQCYQLPILWMLAGEIIIGCGGVMLVSAFQPASMFEWSLGIWMFFLIQSLYFVIFAGKSATIKKIPPRDPFESARGRAEEIIAATIG
ncbi:MAG: hypothetical protein QNI92_00670 [Desulfobacterales bacterium]|nr:hypothetical protein [Desulfobacterales bacterium]